MVDTLCAAPLDDLCPTIPFQITIVFFIVNKLGQIERKTFSVCKVLHSVQVFSHASIKSISGKEKKQMKETP